MILFIIFAILFLLTALKATQTTRGKDVFITYAIIACICALASAHLSQKFVMLLCVAGVSLITYVFYKEGKKK